MTEESQKILRTGKPKASFRERKQDIEMLSELIHKIGHDIGNPLTSVISYASVLERLTSPESTQGVSPEKLTQYAQSIGSEAWKISHVIERLVLLLSERAGETMSTDVLQTLDRVTTKLRNRYGLTGVQLTVNRPEERMYAAVDPEQLLALLTELTINAWEAEKAVRATGTDSPSPVAVELATEGDKILIQVKNRSIPSGATLENLFEPFVKYPEEKRALGVGLTVCEAIVTRHNGSIAIEETTEAGATTFSVTVRLPVAPEQS